jgi:hypothetical protein
MWDQLEDVELGSKVVGVLEESLMYEVVGLDWPKIEIPCFE